MYLLWGSVRSTKKLYDTCSEKLLAYVDGSSSQQQQN